MSKGFIPIRRSLFKHFLYKEHRVFSRFEAWLDLLQLASFTDGQTDLIQGKMIVRNRGEIIASLRWLSGRWNWSKHKTSDFLEVLRSTDMVVVAIESGVTKLSLVNFERYNSIGKDEWDSNWDRQTNDNKGNTSNKGTQKGTVKNNPTDSKRDSNGDRQNDEGQTDTKNEGTPEGTQKGTVAGQSRDSEGTNNNKDNNSKKGNGESDGAGAPPPPPGDGELKLKQEAMLQRRKDFGQQLVPHVETYGKSMVRDFFNHWTEPNKSRTGMRFELQRTWDLGGRLRTWEKRELEWKKGSHRNDPPPNKARPGLTKTQEEINYLYGRYLEDMITVISVDWTHFNEIVKAELMILTPEEVVELRRQALEHMQKDNTDITDDLTVKYAKRFGVLEFFRRHKAQGKETVFECSSRP